MTRQPWRQATCPASARTTFAVRAKRWLACRWRTLCGVALVGLLVAWQAPGARAQEEASTESASPAPPMAPGEVAAAATTTPTAADAKALAESVRGWVVALDAPTLAEREAAEDALLAAGPAALDHLPSESAQASAEVRQRVARVRQALFRQRAAGFAEGSTVSWSGEKATLSEVLIAWERQSGNRLVDFRENFDQDVEDVAVELAVDSKPFWPALDELLDAAGMTVYGFSGEPGVAVVRRGERQSLRRGRACYQGAFRIEPILLDAHGDLRDPGNTSLLLRLEVAWEPRLMPVGVTMALADVEAVDDQGEVVEVARPESESEALLTSGMMTTEIDIPLVPPPRDRRSIANLTGRLSVLAPGGIETFRFDRLDQRGEKRQTRGSVAVGIDEVRKNNELWEVRVRVGFDETSGAIESHHDWVFENEAYLEGPAGRRDHDGYETTLQSESEVGVAYLFDVPQTLAGYTFVYKTPAVLLTVPVEFELRDLPLP